MDRKEKKASKASMQPSFMICGVPINVDQHRASSSLDCNNLCYTSNMQQPLSELIQGLDSQSLPVNPLDYRNKTSDLLPSSFSTMNDMTLDWDPKAMLSNLSFLEEKIHQVQNIVRSIANQEGKEFSNRANELAAHQQLVTADLTSIIIQLISTAGTLLPSTKNNLVSANPSVGQWSNLIGSQASSGMERNFQNKQSVPLEDAKLSEYVDIIKELNNSNEVDDLINVLDISEGEKVEPMTMEHQDLKDTEDGGDTENLPPGSYEILQLEKEEILAPHTHFCTICGKGFKRDANLRMHMRGHGDEYKTAAALAKPAKELSSDPVVVRRYSCPFVGCKRNKEHKKFQPLKTILCVKNHYKRSHCDKSYTCSRCNTKKFSVIADLKTHEKHCGRDKWLCSCGTTFSRKDKLFGHVALFQGHTPALPIDDIKVSGSRKQSSGLVGGKGSMKISASGNSIINGQVSEMKCVDEDRGFFSPMNFDSFNFGGIDDFASQPFGVSESLSIISSEKSDVKKKEDYLNSNNFN